LLNVPSPLLKEDEFCPWNDPLGLLMYWLVGPLIMFPAAS